MTPTLVELLERLPERLAPARMDRIWVFPPRGGGGRETGVVVFSLLAAAGGATREVHLLRYRAESERGRVTVTDALTHEATVPDERLPGVIAGVIRRAGAGDEADPRELVVGGTDEGWARVREALAAEVHDPEDHP